MAAHYSQKFADGSRTSEDLERLCLSPMARHCVYGSVVRRMQGGDPVEVPQWKLGRGLAIPKAGDMKEVMAGWRALTMAPAAAKLYEAFWWATALAHLRPLPPSLLGFMVGCRTLDMALPLQVLFSRVAEWGQPLVLASLGVAAAFDEMRPMEVAASLRESGCPATLVAAWHREKIASTVAVQLWPVSTPSIPLWAGCREGCPARQCLWNNLLAGPMATSRAPGHPSYSTLLCWSGRIMCLFSRSLGINYQCVWLKLSAARSRGQRFSDSPLEVLANEAAGEGSLAVLQTQQRFARVQTLRVLGIGLDSAGSTQSMIVFRLQEARKVWFRHRSTLCGESNAPESRRQRAVRRRDVVTFGVHASLA